MTKISEKDILCDCIEHYIEIANKNPNTLNSYCLIIAFLFQLKEHYPQYDCCFDKYIDLFNAEGILRYYTENKTQNIADIYFKKYADNITKAEEIIHGYIHECPNRFFNFMIAIGIIGPPNSKDKRLLLAKAYSWNSYAFVKQSIYYTDLCLKDNKKDSFLLELNAENYLKSKEYGVSLNYYKKALAISDNSYLYKRIISIYRKTNNLDGAIKFLKGEKKSFKNLFNKERKNDINKYLRTLESEKIGIVKHDFSGYNSIETLWNASGTYNIKKNRYIELKNKYKEVFENHIKRLDAISVITTNGINNENIYSLMDLVKSDVKEFYKIENFYKELNSIGMNNTYYYSDNYIKGYLMPKKICMLLEKENFIDEAILICNCCIENNILEDGTKSGMRGRQKRLKEKISKIKK